VVREETGGGAIFVWWEVKTKVRGPMITAESRGDGLFTVIDELRKNFAILEQCTRLSAFHVVVFCKV